MAKIAKKRGIATVLGVAEFLPFKQQEFDLVLIVTALAFFKDSVKALGETFEVLKPGGQLIVGILDRDSPLGSCIEPEKKESRFFPEARFLSATEVSTYLVEIGFENLKICQTLFKQPESIEHVELPQKGHGIGIFAVISARKPDQEL